MCATLVFTVIFKLGSHLCRYALIVTPQNATLSSLNIHSAWYNFTYCIHYWAEYFCWFAYNGKCFSFQGQHQCFYILIASVLLLAQLIVTSCPKMYTLLGMLKRCFIIAMEQSILNLPLKQKGGSEVVLSPFSYQQLSLSACVWVCVCVCICTFLCMCI